MNITIVSSTDDPNDGGRRDRRRGRPPHQPIPLDALRRADGRPMSVRDLCGLTGFSRPKIMADIDGKHLAATRVPCGTKGQGQWVIAFVEAQRYLRALQIL